MLESYIQSKIIKKLKKRGFFVYKHPPVPTGMPDIHAIKDGHSYFFEVKRDAHHKPSPIQKYMHKKLRKHGATVKVVWSWEQVKEELR